MSGAEHSLGGLEFRLKQHIQLLAGRELLQDRAFQMDEVRTQAVDAQRRGEVGVVVVAGVQLDDVAEVVDGVVDRRGGQEEHLLGPAVGPQVALQLGGSARAP